ncbi:Protein of unknown function [Psychroflexus salarius]|uniref:DUF3108 domain-containing protein n=1 Tax=Psychroflexus salarius TaxID=1155689 RepID=A0A1M4VMY1_9FLAO|nr:DUF3108 domain-containing protein [Psychroflexus salarius]SHE70349.1 Protein of unknown function [Psychroflexus salarius]
MKKIAFILLLHSFASVHSQAYQNGEWLKFKIKYGWFKASEATIEVKKAKIKGQKVLHIDGFGKSTGLLDVFFKVRDHYETYINPDTNLPVRFVRRINEGGYKKNKILNFNHTTNTVEVIDKKHNTKNSFSFIEGTQDMMSVLYFLRNKVDIKRLKPGQTFTLNLFFDEENYPFKVKFLKKEILETKFGDISTLKFRPYVKADRVFKEQESLSFWVSADENKVPLKIEAKLAVGSLTANLDQFKGLKHSFSIIAK